MSHRTLLVPGLAALAAGALIGLAFSGRLTSEAVQNPSLRLDMVPAGNTYDGATNTMSVGAIDQCVSDPSTVFPHNRTAHLIVQNVEDLVGAQVRISHLDVRMEPTSVNWAPFEDPNTFAPVGFLNLPIDPAAGGHRTISSASDFTQPNTSLASASYVGEQTFAISPDTPAKAVPDDSSYSAPRGGILATVVMQLKLNANGIPSNFLNLDDTSPNAPGSSVDILTGTGIQKLNLSNSQLGDGYVGSGTGVTCVVPPCDPDCEAFGSIVNETFTNNTGQTASDLHVTFTGIAGARVVQNAPGCPSPVASPPGASRADIDWGIACVEAGESVVLEITSEPPASVQCSHWTISGTPIGTPCPPGPSPNPCPPGTTPTPTTFTTTESFTNQTGQTASDLHARYGGPIAICLLENAPGCPDPEITNPGGSSQYDINWGTACVDDGEVVRVRVTSEPPASRLCSEWTQFDFPLGPGTPGDSMCTTTPTPAPTFTPTGHDARLTRISGVPKNIRLSPDQVVTDTANITVVNQGGHAETIGVYVDVMEPQGCLPRGRVLETTVTLAAGAKTTIPVPVSYSCFNPAAANGLSYSWVAVADHGADDRPSCWPGGLQGLTCFNALADDDEDPADNRLSRNGPKVIAQ